MRAAQSDSPAGQARGVLLRPVSRTSSQAISFTRDARSRGSSQFSPRKAKRRAFPSSPLSGASPMPTPSHRHTLARRGFLQLGTAGLCGLGLPQLLEMEARARAAGPGETKGSPARSVILVWLGGGPSTIDMWDLKPQAGGGIPGVFRPNAMGAAGSRIGGLVPGLA